MDRLFFAPTVNSRWGLCIARFWMVLVAVTGIIAAISGASAIGPDLPLQFRDDGRRVELLLDETQISKLEAEQIVYDHGRPLHQQRLALRPEKKRQERMAVAVVPLDLERFSDLPPGYYGMKLVAVGSPSDPQSGAVPLHVEWWVHFAVDEGRVRRVMEGEYSAAADPVESGRGDSGEQIFTHQGGGLQGEVPLQKTEHSEDVEVLPSRPMRGEPGAGRHGGRAMEELTTPRSQPKGDDDRRQR